jgi:hypothetical protein
MLDREFRLLAKDVLLTDVGWVALAVHSADPVTPYVLLYRQSGVFTGDLSRKASVR